MKVGLLAEYMGWVVAAIVGAFALRANVRLDINALLKDRRERKEETLRLLCPHVEPDWENGKAFIRSRYTSLSGTSVWTCQDCGKQTSDRTEVERVGEYWAEHPVELLELRKKMNKLARRLGRG